MTPYPPSIASLVDPFLRKGLFCVSGVAGFPFRKFLIPFDCPQTKKDSRASLGMTIREYRLV